MTDQCKYCILKEKLNDCLKSDCGHHENWINKELMQKINQQAAELAALRLEAKSAILKERDRCLNIVQNNQCRNGYHNHEGTTLGHYDMKMIDEIKKGES